MTTKLTAEFERTNLSIHSATAPPSPPSLGYASRSNSSALALHYENVDPRHGIHFQVHKLPFEQLQVIDARLLTIAPGATNEKHRHAHESIFLVLQGQALLQIDGEEVALAEGDLAYVPRWSVHQTRNCSQEAPLRLLALTDFGLTSALLGNYDRATRLKTGGPKAYT